MASHAARHKPSQTDKQVETVADVECFSLFHHRAPLLLADDIWRLRKTDRTAASAQWRLKWRGCCVCCAPFTCRVLELCPRAYQFPTFLLRISYISHNPCVLFRLSSALRLPNARVSHSMQVGRNSFRSGRTTTRVPDKTQPRSNRDPPRHPPRPTPNWIHQRRGAPPGLTSPNQ